MNLYDLLNLFGNSIESTEAKNFFSKYDKLKFKFEEPEDGSQYVLSQKLGIDLLYRPDDGIQGGDTDLLRKCQSAFLYSQGRDDHEQFQGEIPLGFSFSDSRGDLISKKSPIRTWKIGIGEVPLNSADPSSDRWEFKKFYISAHYAKSGALMYFIISNRNA